MGRRSARRSSRTEARSPMETLPKKNLIAHSDAESQHTVFQRLTLLNGRAHSCRDGKN
jgi:hypothetical protein